jgi:cobalt-zinc-cadmium resistance protein CzcA
MQGTQEINSMPRTFGLNDRFTGIQAGISVPLWYKPYAAKIKVAGIRQDIARIDADSYSRTLASEYASLLDEYTKFKKSVDFYEKQAIPEAGYIIEQSGRSYKSGAMNYLDYVMNFNRAIDIRQNYLNALHDCVKALIRIEYVSGKI